MSLFGQETPTPRIGEPAVDREVKPHRLLAGGLYTLGILILIAGPFVGFLGAAVNPILGIAIWIGATALATGVIRRAKRLKSVGALAAMEYDHRLPVLYLRSFNADERVAETVGTGFSIKGFDITLPTTEEEQIARVSRMVGPLVAIGRPTESLPLLGAARMYLSEDRWQDEVLALIDRSALLLMRVGKTEGFWWEVENTVRRAKPERLLWIVPYSGDNYREFATRANTVLPKPIPLDSGPMPHSVGSIKGWIWFEPDWTPHLEKPTRGQAMNQASPVASLLFGILRPIFVRMGEADAALQSCRARRFGAFAIDAAIAWLLIVPLMFLGNSPQANTYFLTIAILWVLYLVVMDLPGLGGTLGKRIMKVRVVGQHAESPSAGISAVRSLSKVAGVVLFPITSIYLMFSWTRSLRYRLPHDYLTRTYVID